MQPDDEVRRVPDDERNDVYDAGWSRRTEEPHVRGVELYKDGGQDEWPWVIVVWAMQFVFEEPLEGELRDAMIAALVEVPGVTAAAEEDREVWIVDGTPSAEALIHAATGVVDRFADRVRAHIAELR
ncbi:MAG: hypothetical protein M3Q30_05755 [Actinomycetota bacterium]|nr:hypothetical protein [Actinomycetota bacterium]